MTVDEQIQELKTLLTRLQTARESPRPAKETLPSLMTFQEAVDRLDEELEAPRRDETLMRAYVYRLEEAVRLARQHVPPSIARACFGALDEWLGQHYWLDFVNR